MCSSIQLSSLAVIFLFLINSFELSNGCSNRFEGFGVFLGQLRSLNRTSLGTIESVLKLVHDDLGLRHYRTEYPHEFSLQPNQVEIKCHDPVTCTWINVHQILARNFPDVKVFASIWSAPKYMLNKVWPNLRYLRTQYQSQYYHYLKRVTQMIDKIFGIKIERISIVNEPEDVFADWDHMNLLPSTLCNLVDLYDDDLLRVCPENAWFMFTRFYMLLPSCQQACDIIATHSYGLSSKVEAVTSVLSKKTPDVSYDLQKRRGNWAKPIWMTEVSSPGKGGEERVVEEAIDFAKNIINYVGYTCVTRYYYWLAFTDKPSGESLIWANRKVQQSDQFENDYDRFILPKKYFVYRHFSHSSMPHGERTAHLCTIDGMFECLRFDDNYIFVNSDQENSVMAPDFMPLCCTTRDVDYDCNFDSNSIPPQSICSSVDAK